MVNQSGTDSFALTSTGTATLDAVFWQGMSWYDPKNGKGKNGKGVRLEKWKRGQVRFLEI
jgi:hypothetical protein